jgi:hypothetical protein
MKKNEILAILILSLSISMFLIDYSTPSVKTFPSIELGGVAAIIWYLRALHKNYSSFIYTSIYQIYSLIGIVFSLIFIGYGTPMLEINEEGMANGSIWVAFIFLIAGLEAGRIGYSLPLSSVIGKPKRLNYDLVRIAVYCASFFVLGVGLFILVNYGGAYFSGMTRVAFWNIAVPDVFRLYPSLLGQTFFLAAFLYLDRRQKAIKTGASLLIVILYIISTIIIAGEKFSTLIFYIVVWFCLCAGFYKRLVLDAKAAALAGAVFLSILGITVLTYIVSGTEVAFLIFRIAMQGQMLWSVLNESFEIIFFGADWSCILGCGLYDAGSDYISDRYLPRGTWDSYVETGSSLTGFMPSLPIFSLGLPVALLLHISVSFVFGIIQRVLVFFIERRDLITSFLLFKVYFGLLIFWYASRETVLPGVMVATLVLFVWIFIFRSSPSKSSPLNATS